MVRERRGAPWHPETPRRSSPPGTHDSPCAAATGRRPGPVWVLDAAVLGSQELTRGIRTPDSAEILEYCWDQGDDREVLLRLVVDRVARKRDARRSMPSLAITAQLVSLLPSSRGLPATSSVRIAGP